MLCGKLVYRWIRDETVPLDAMSCDPPRLTSISHDVTEDPALSE